MPGAYLTGHAASSLIAQATSAPAPAPPPSPPQASFTATPLVGADPLDVQYTDTSTGTPTSWAWDFTNNGSTDSTVQHPLHTHTGAAAKSPKLTVTNAYGSTSLVRQDYILVETPAPAAKPKTAVIAAGYYKGFPSSTAQATTVGNLMGRAHIAISGFYPTYPTARISAWIQAVKNTNPDCITFNYTVPSEAPVNAAHAVIDARLDTVLSDGKDGWMRNAAGQKGYFYALPSYETNLTTASPAHADGKRYRQWIAEYYTSVYFSGTTYGYNGCYIDNFFQLERYWVSPTTTYDADRNNTNSSITTTLTSAANTALRVGRVAYGDFIRSNNPGILLMGNCVNPGGHEMNSTEYNGYLDYSFLEGYNVGYTGAGNFTVTAGQPTSGPSTTKWNAMMATYANHEARTREGVICHWRTGATDYSKMRFGACSTWMRNGYIFWEDPTLDGTEQIEWADEFNQLLGTAVDPVQTAAWSNSVWVREYTNGLVVCNPTASSKAVNLTTKGAGLWKRFVGTQDATTNSGANITGSITIAAWDGLLLLKQ